MSKRNTSTYIELYKTLLLVVADPYLSQYGCILSCGSQGLMCSSVCISSAIVKTSSSSSISDELSIQFVDPEDGTHLAHSQPVRVRMPVRGLSSAHYVKVVPCLI